MPSKETTNFPPNSQPKVSETAPRTRIGFVSLGCPKNLVDSEVMMGFLAHAGAEITPRAEDADVIVVNTCSFIESAKQESIDSILEMAQHKIQGRARKLIVAGCLVERYRNEIQASIPEVDAVVGTGELEEHSAPPRASLPAPAEAIRHSRSSRRVLKVMHASSRAASRASNGTAPSPICPTISTTRTRRACWRRPSHSAYIKIAEGCDHPCAFCIIPQLRGKFRSRRLNR